MFGQASRFFPGALFVATGAVVLGVSSPAPADTIEIFADTANSTEGLGDFSGFLTYVHTIGEAGVLTVEITNTTANGNRGWITGFIFNIDSDDPDASAKLEDTTHPFLDAPGENGSPFGNPFLGGAALAGNWIDGGIPEDGIAMFDTGIFTFEIESTDAASLTALSFLGGPFDFNFIVRLRGFIDGASDKVPAIPAPGALALLGLGALAQRRRRRSA